MLTLDIKLATVALESDFSKEYQAWLKVQESGGYCYNGAPVKLLLQSCYELYKSAILGVLVWVIASFLIILLIGNFKNIKKRN